MNLESGFPIPHNKNRDSWSSVTPGMPISNENGITDSWSRMSVSHANGTGDSWSGMPIPRKNGIGNSLTMMTPRRPIPMGNGVLGSGDSRNVTPERTIAQRNGIGTPMEPRSNPIDVEKQENENWEDLIGMYTNLLQEETLDLNRIVEDLNPTPPTKMNLNSRPSCNQASTSLSCTSSMLENQQTRPFTSNNLINGEHNTKEDGFPVTYRPCYNLNSPPRAEPNADFPFVPITPDNQIKHTNNQRVPKNVDLPVLDTSTPAKNRHENQTVSLEDAESLYNELLQTIRDSPSSAISTTQKEHNAETDEHAIDLNKTPEQKTPARRKKHRPRVIKEGKAKRTPKPKDPKNETRVKRKYVRKMGVNTPKTNENGVAKRKYVHKKGIDNVESQHESQQKSNVDDVVDTQANSCKKRLNFDLEHVARDENNINVDSQDIEQERRINNILETSAVKILQQNQYTVTTMQAENQHVSGQALNMLATNMTMRNSIPVQSFGLDERRGIKRPIYRNVNAMESIRLYQKMLLGVENGTTNRDNMSRILLENHKKMKMQMHGVYGNGSAMELLNSYEFRTPVGVMHKHQVSSGMQPHAIRWTPGREISSVRGMLGWSLPPTPPKAACGSAVTSYPATLLEKKQSVKTDLYNGMLNGADQMLQQHHNNYQRPLPIAKGQMRKEKVAVLVDDITTKLEGLCIYDKNENERNALVLYKGSEAMIPFEPIKKRIPRPKVDLDPETDRLWKLLMGKEGSEGAETMDKDKEKWWENERRVFRGRADSFIARMHLVQGDRRFSRWKGSVVDSVIGVFLTQNVSDHLSSSAFMSLAAKFPLKSTTKETHFQDRTRVLVEEPIEVIEPNNIIKKQSGNKEDVILSQDSFDSSTIQTVDEIRSSSGSNSEAEDQTNGSAPVAEKVSVFKESFGQEYWNTLVDEQATIAHRLPKNKDFSMQIPRINETNNNLNESFASFNSGMTENGTGKQGITISFEANSKEHKYVPQEAPSRGGTKVLKERENEAENLKNRTIDWDGLRKQVFLSGEKRERSKDATDSLDYEAVRCAHVNEISDAIKERGMNNLLADRIKDFLNRLVRDHGSIDLEWLRDAPPDKAKDYLLSFRGLGLKSVECVRLLTLHHLAFPVDTNVGRIAVRLGWVPLQPLPESLQLHLLEMYPVLESIQKYLWPRLCKLDQLTLYELHYQMITFGKVFCTKSKPNCNACPMRAECRHFASAFASARLALPGPEEKRIVTSDAPIATDPTPPVVNRPMALPQAENNYNTNAETFGQSCEPIIEEPTSPEPEIAELSMSDIEDQYYEDSDEIPSIKLNMEEFTMNLQNIMEDGTELQDDMSKALVALNPNAGSIPTPKLKNVSRLRTEHQVYELPDSHRLLEGLDKREPDDPSPYLLAIWTPGETANSIQPPERGCPTQESGKLCDQATCFSCNSIKEANSQVVRGTILIPCRTAMRGSFPLNGTYFQVNEMFADHASSLNPIDVPRAWIWNLPRRTVYFGTSVSTIFKGLTTEGIQYCFWRGFVCVRGFDQKTRAPRPLMARLHFPASKLKTKNEGK